MSYIFDALQRSQTERTGANAIADRAAIALLELTERQVTAQRSSGSSAVREAETDACDSLFSCADLSREESAGNPTAIRDAFEAEERREIFNEFKTLEVSRPANGRLACFADADSPASEAFRLLGVRLRSVSRKRALKSLLITSTVPQEGKSVIAANLACTLASDGQQKVLLLEGDVRRPGLWPLFGLGAIPGLCSYLQGERGFQDCVYRLGGPGLWILPAGEIPKNPVELIQSPRLPALMEKLSALFDWIVIDSPPVLPMADTSVWARAADGILLVARQGVSMKRKLLKGLEALDTNKLIGALLNSAVSTDDSDYYYYRRTRGVTEQTKVAADR